MIEHDLQVPPRHLKNLHEIMTDTYLSSPMDMDDPGGPSLPMTVRVHPVIKEKAAEICKGNGTNLSAFIRRVVMQLVLDYQHSAPTPSQLIGETPESCG